jgi:Leucine-rich repeat (LRR) protein
MMNLTEVESLDLSKNQLSAEIPPQLTRLTFLAVMNLSYTLIDAVYSESQRYERVSETLNYI